MTAAVLDAPEQTGTGSDDGLHHIFICHDEDTAYCGIDLTGIPITPFSDAAAPDVCVVCRDLARVHCGCPCGCCAGLGGGA